MFNLRSLFVLFSLVQGLSVLHFLCWWLQLIMLKMDDGGDD
jgi:hypothetical protein